MKENMKKIRKIMRISIFEVFEKLFFVFLEPLDDANDKYDMEAAIRFDGSVSGEIRIQASKNVVKAMVQNMLGLNADEVNRHDMEDCLKEAANMVCGNLLGKYDSTQVFNLSTPTFAEKCKDIELKENTFRLNFDSENGKVSLIAKLDE